MGDVISIEKKRKEYSRKKCEHLTVTLDSETGILVCKDCGELLTCESWVNKIADKENTVSWKFQELEKKINEYTICKCPDCGKRFRKYFR